jgi:hypothetical protein
VLTLSWLGGAGIEAIAVMTLLALAADRRGASFYSRQRVAAALATDLATVDKALTRLRDLGLVDLRPWRAGVLDGVWQILPLPSKARDPRRHNASPVAIASLLRSLGFHPE